MSVNIMEQFVTSNRQRPNNETEKIRQTCTKSVIHCKDCTDCGVQNIAIPELMIF